MQEQENSAAIAALNDELRTSLGQKGNGQITMTAGITAFTPHEQVLIFQKVKTFSDFNEDNDPYGEHDFGSVIHEGQRVFFKFDYYDKSLQYASEDPSDPECTTRVMTILLASEY